MLITLTTDFGCCDSYVAQMKGVIYSIAPKARIVDVSHDIPAQDIVIGAQVIASAVDAFPDSTIHVGVIDPGVGSARAELAIETKDCVFIGPDNGLFTLALRHHPMVRAVRLTNPEYHRPKVSSTFHGRDVFAPAAAHLANGVPLESLGDMVEQITLAPWSEPEILSNLIHADVLMADRFGNLITNLDRATYETWRGRTPDAEIRVAIHDTQLQGIRRTFCDVPIGHCVAYFGSGGQLEIATRDGNAAAVLVAGRATPIRVRKPSMSVDRGH